MVTRVAPRRSSAREAARRFRRARMCATLISKSNTRGFSSKTRNDPSVSSNRLGCDRTSAFTTARCAHRTVRRPRARRLSSEPPSRGGPARDSRRATRAALHFSPRAPGGAVPPAPAPGLATRQAEANRSSSARDPPGVGAPVTCTGPASRIVSKPIPRPSAPHFPLSSRRRGVLHVRVRARDASHSRLGVALGLARRLGVALRAPAPRRARSAPRPRAGCSSRRRHPGARYANPDAASARRPPRRPRSSMGLKPPWRPPRRRAPPHISLSSVAASRRASRRASRARPAIFANDFFFKSSLPSLTRHASAVASARARSQLRLGAFRVGAERVDARGFEKNGARDVRQFLGERLVAHRPEARGRDQHGGGGREAALRRAASTLTLAGRGVTFPASGMSNSRSGRRGFRPKLLFSIAAASSASRVPARAPPRRRRPARRRRPRRARLRLRGERRRERRARLGRGRSECLDQVERLGLRART